MRVRHPAIVFFLALCTSSFSAGSASARTADDWFWNGDERIALSIDASEIGVLFDSAATAAQVKKVVAQAAFVDRAAFTTFAYVPGHLFHVKLAKGASVADALSTARTIGQDAAVLAAGPRFVAGDEPYFVTDEILVRFRSDADPSAIAAIESANDLTRSGTLDYAVNPGVVYRLPHGRSLDALAVSRDLFESGLCEFAIPDFSIVRVPYATTNDPLYPNQWHLKSTGQGGAVLGADVDAPAAWDVTRGDPNLIIAIVDTGVELTHPDLVANLVPGTDVLDNDNNPQATDYLFGLFTENHSTSVHGISGGPGNNGVGTTGIAQNCKLMPIRFLSEFILVQPTVQDEADAFNYARAHGAAIVNNSWGPGGAAALPASTKAAIDDCAANGRGGLGTLIFFAAGNESASIDQNGYASYAKVVGVSASTDQNLIASYSNTGIATDICAPSNGGVTTGTWTTDRLGSVGYSTGDYTGAFGGTSSASPLAAGTAALVMSANPYLSWDEVLDVLEDTADKIDVAGGAYDGNGHSNKYGYGKVNAGAAVVEAKNRPPHGVVLYGNGLAGTGGLVPKIGANSVPKAGNAGFAFTLAQGRPSGTGYFIVGFARASVPVVGGTLLVDVGGPFAIVGLGLDGAGALSIGAPIPSVPSPVGVVFDAQWIGIDPAAVAGYSFTRGLEGTIQP